MNTQYTWSCNTGETEFLYVNALFADSAKSYLGRACSTAGWFHPLKPKKCAEQRIGILLSVRRELCFNIWMSISHVFPSAQNFQVPKSYNRVKLVVACKASQTYIQTPYLKSLQDCLISNAYASRLDLNGICFDQLKFMREVWCFFFVFLLLLCDWEKNTAKSADSLSLLLECLTGNSWNRASSLKNHLDILAWMCDSN